MDEEAWKDELGRALRRLAAEAHLTQTALAAKLGAQQGQVSRWFSGQGVSPAVANKVEAALGLSRGLSLRLAGFVESSITTEEAVRLDSLLTAAGQAAVLDLYHSLARNRVRRAKPRHKA